MNRPNFYRKNPLTSYNSDRPITKPNTWSPRRPFHAKHYPLGFIDYKQRFIKEKSINLDLLREKCTLREKLDEERNIADEKSSELRQVELQMSYQKEKLNKLYIAYEVEQEKSSRLEALLLEKDNELQGMHNELRELKAHKCSADNQSCDWEQKYLEEVELNKSFKKCLVDNNQKARDLTEVNQNLQTKINSINLKLKQIEENLNFDTPNMSPVSQTSETNDSKQASNESHDEGVLSLALSVHAKIDSFKKYHDVKLSELEQEKLKSQVLSNDLNELKQAETSYQTKISTMENELNDLNMKIKTTVEDKLRAQLKNFELSEEIKNLTAKWTHSQIENSKKTIKFNSQLAEIQAYKADLEKYKYLVFELSTLLLFINDFDVNNTSSNASKLDLNFESRLNERISSIKDKEIYLRRAKEISINYYENIKDKFMNLKTGLNFIKRERDELIQKTKRMSSKSPKNQEIEKLFSQLKEEQDKNKRLRNENSNLAESVKSSEAKLEEAETNWKKLNKLFVNLDLRFKNLLAKHGFKPKSDLESSITELENYLQIQTGKMNSLNEQLSCVRSDNSLLMSNFKQKESNLQTEIKNLKYLNHGLSIEIEERNYDIDQLKAKLEKHDESDGEKSQSKKRKNFSE